MIKVTHMEQILAHIDGSVEAAKHKFLPWLLMMWHPERRKKINKYEIKLIKDHFYK